MNRITLPILVSLILVGTNCDNQITDSNPNNKATVQIPLVEKNINCDSLDSDFYTGDFSFDKEGNLWISAVFCDTSADIPPWSNIMCKGLWQLWCYDGHQFTLKYDSLDVSVEQIHFDNNNQCWLLNSKQIMTIKQDTLSIVFNIENEAGLFNSMAIDNENNVWVGGLRTGLLKINSNAITHMTTETSQLPTNTTTKILVDENRLWVALWNHEGLLKIEDNSWEIFNANNSNLSSQNIWDLTTDINGDLWIGIGWRDSTKCLTRFNGSEFITENPGDNDSIIAGTVRHLTADNTGRVYAVTLKTKNNSDQQSILSCWENGIWHTLLTKYKPQLIKDIEVNQNKLWVSTYNDIFYLE